MLLSMRIEFDIISFLFWFLFPLSGFYFCSINITTTTTTTATSRYESKIGKKPYWNGNRFFFVDIITSNQQGWPTTLLYLCDCVHVYGYNDNNNNNNNKYWTGKKRESNKQ